MVCNNSDENFIYKWDESGAVELICYIEIQVAKCYIEVQLIC